MRWTLYINAPEWKNVSNMVVVAIGKYCSPQIRLLIADQKYGHSGLMMKGPKVHGRENSRHCHIARSGKVQWSWMPFFNVVGCLILPDFARFCLDLPDDA
jgi:hypothetical protein